MFDLLRPVISFIDEYINIVTLFVYSMKSVISNRKKSKKLFRESMIKQIYFTGVKALAVMGAVSLSIGGVVIFIANKFSLSDEMTSTILIITVIQYVGPLITMIILIGRSGTPIATEIGNMQVNNEIEALEIMGIDSLYYIVAPRIIGMTISVFCLCVYFSFIGILGGGVVMVNLIDEFSISKFYQSFFRNVEVLHIIDNIFKSVGFGIITSTVCCYQGLKVKGATTEVPQTTTQAVSRSIVLCILFYAYITIIFSI